MPQVAQVVDLTAWAHFTVGPTVRACGHLHTHGHR